MNEIGLSSLDGQQWHDAEDKPGAQDIVTRVVIGTLDAKEPITITDGLWQQVLAHWPTITHLHLWSIAGLNALPALPAKLECLDIRHCRQIESLPALPDTLATLDLAGCTALKQPPSGATPSLRFLHLDGCTGLRASAINTKIGACPMLEELTLAGCTQLHELEEPASSDAPPLRKLVLKDCAKLHTLPDLSAFGRLNHLNLNGCAALAALPPLPILEDPDPPRAWHEPVRGLRYLVTQGCEKLREYRGLDLRPVHLSADADDNVIDTLRALHWLGQPPAELLSSKLLLLGSGRVGKTTLAKALQWADLDGEARKSERGQALDPRKGSASTHGIQFWPWRCAFALPHGGGQRHGRVHIWDFAGQEIYHNTHRLFAASGAVFVIVCCDRNTHATRLQREIDQQGLNGAEREAFERENEYREVRYWLDYVRAALGLKEDAAERLPVILVHSGAKGSKTDYLLQQAGPYRAAIEARTLPVLALDCTSEAFLDDADFKGLRAELARRLGASADQLGIRVPAFYRDVHATVEALLNDGRPHPEQAVFTFAKWRQHLIDALGQPSAAPDAFHGAREMGDGGTTAGSVVSGAAPTPTLPRARGRESDRAAPYPALAFQPSVLRAVTRHLHRIGQVFWLDEQAEGDVIVDQALGAKTIYSLCRSSTEADQMGRQGGLVSEEQLGRLLDEVKIARDAALDTSQLLQLLAKCGVCLPIGAGRWQALNPALLPPLNPAIRAAIGGQWFELLGQTPGYVNHSFRLSGDGGMQIGAADMQATLAWLLRYGLHDGDEGQRLPRWMALGEDASEAGPGKAEGERGPAIRWHPQYHFWRAGVQILWTPAFDREHRWRKDARTPAPGESPGDPFLLRIQYAPFDLKDARGERTLAYAGSLYLELLTRNEAGMAPRLCDALLAEGGPLAFFRDHYQIDDQRTDDLPAERIGHPRDDRMLPWQRARNPAEPRMRHDVAISVRGSDVDVAEPLYQALRRAGLEAYYYRDDERGKLHGDKERESGLVEIYDYLDQATCLILIGSNRYFDLSDATAHGGNIYCPVELAAAVASLQRDDRPRQAEQIFVLAVSREGDEFHWHAFDSKVKTTVQAFDAIVTARGKPHSLMQRKERDWVEAASDGIAGFVHDVGSQAKRAVFWNGRAETRDAAIAELVRRVRAALKAGD